MIKWDTRTIILLASLMLLMYLWGYSVGEFSMRWEMARILTRKTLVKNFDPPKSDTEID